MGVSIDTQKRGRDSREESRKGLWGGVGGTGILIRILRTIVPNPTEPHTS